jgi:hypothetical protein
LSQGSGGSGSGSRRGSLLTSRPSSDTVTNAAGGGGNGGGGGGGGGGSGGADDASAGRVEASDSFNADLAQKLLATPQMAVGTRVARMSKQVNPLRYGGVDPPRFGVAGEKDDSNLIKAGVSRTSTRHTLNLILLFRALVCACIPPEGETRSDFGPSRMAPYDVSCPIQSGPSCAETLNRMTSLDVASCQNDPPARRRRRLRLEPQPRRRVWPGWPRTFCPGRPRRWRRSRRTPLRGSKSWWWR